MAIELMVKPGPAISREQFITTHPPYSIALDGYVYGEPFLYVDERGPWRNFNHHEMVDRSCTAATCEQARRAVLLGIYELFCEGGERRATLWVNDCDQDVCLATWILMNPQRANEPLLAAITHLEDLLDMSAGSFPLPHSRDLLAESSWVFEPYSSQRARVVQMSAEEMRRVIVEVHERIERYLAGRADKLRVQGSYVRIGGGPGWALVEVTGAPAREQMVAEGISAAVELIAQAGGRYVYTIWRRSEYIVHFPVRAILRALNEAEGFAPDDPSGWGGSDNVGGSPRARGSALGPERVAQVVESVLCAQNQRVAGR